MRHARDFVIGFVGVSWAAYLTPPAAAAQGLTQDEALAVAFPPPAVVERRTAFLDAAQRAQAAAQAGRGVEMGRSVVTYYVGRVDGELAGVAYFDAHRVRTLPEVVMVVVTPEREVGHIEVVRFAEPPEYRAPPGWLAQFAGRGLNDALSTRREVVGITGATLTAEAVTQAVRRVLALHAVIHPAAPVP